MDQFTKVFTHLPEYGVVVCTRCQYAVVPAQIPGHIKTKHRSISAQQRQSIAEAVATLSNIAQAAEEVQYPSATSPAVVGLPVYRDRLRCIKETAYGTCNYICRERTGITRHCREQHQWKNPRRRGRVSREQASEPTEQIWVEQQLYQRFFQTRQ